LLTSHFIVQRIDERYVWLETARYPNCVGPASRAFDLRDPRFMSQNRFEQSQEACVVIYQEDP
jgi:hypothetical protein